MYFYKTDCIIKPLSADKSRNTDTVEKKVRDVLKHKTKLAAEKAEKKVCMFVAEIGTENDLTLCTVSEEPVNDIEKAAAAFLKSANLVLTKQSSTEITFAEFEDYYSEAEDNNYAPNQYYFLEKFNISRRIFPIAFGETVIEKSNESELQKKAKKAFLSKELIPEIARIFEGKKMPKAVGHPVHYMLRCESTQVRREGTRCLISALYSAGRIKSRRYAFVDIDLTNLHLRRTLLDEIYHIASGGCVVIRLNSSPDRDDGEFASNVHIFGQKINELINEYKNTVLTVICLPSREVKLKDCILEMLGNTAVIEINEDKANCKAAREYLKTKAHEAGLRVDKKLFERIGKESIFTVSELDDIFGLWHSSKLLTDVYPQYGITPLKLKKDHENAPVGYAAKELNEMAGLSSAKKVINDAVNYYKMQKLLKSRGMPTKNVSLHMVFTGNPGTAKTTVARLFAQIMRENEILSSGHLIEVGRSDLVGQFVGWTAPTIVEKFEQAKGGVLFIDEAYSLLDDSSGSFGDEAINTIVQQMENMRDDLIVIFAGYPEPMERFLERNPGLRSRIAFKVPFDDYTTSELCEIAKHLCKKDNYTLTDGALENLALLFESARAESDFGNGRYVRNALEKARMAQANRLLGGNAENLTNTDLLTICEQDIEKAPVKAAEAPPFRMGFAG